MLMFLENLMINLWNLLILKTKISNLYKIIANLS